MWIRAALFLVFTVCLVVLSRESLIRPISHGFYRFFAWESILALFFVNLPAWFKNPFSWNQLISWALLCASIILIVSSIHQLRVHGRQQAERGGDELLGLERTTNLVTTGIYHYIRHPMYSSLLALAWGIFLKAPTWVGGAMAVTATLMLNFTVIMEEQENSAFFGSVYSDYSRRTHRFVPFIFLF